MSSNKSLDPVTKLIEWNPSIQLQIFFRWMKPKVPRSIKSTTFEREGKQVNIQEKEKSPLSNILLSMGGKLTVNLHQLSSYLILVMSPPSLSLHPSVPLSPLPARSLSCPTFVFLCGYWTLTSLFLALFFHGIFAWEHISHSGTVSCYLYNPSLSLPSFTFPFTVH